MYKLTYGLFVLTARDGEKDNGCIINTAMQVTTTPNRMIVVVNKQNYTHDMIQRTKPAEKTGWICKICGYVYEGEELPEDYICPICKHPASDFERLN